MLVGTKETLGSGKNVSDNDGGAKGVDYVLVVGMKQKSIVDATWVRPNLPEKPITALICRSSCICKSYIF